MWHDDLDRADLSVRPCRAGGIEILGGQQSPLLPPLGRALSQDLSRSGGPGIWAAVLEKVARHHALGRLGPRDPLASGVAARIELSALGAAQSADLPTATGTGLITPIEDGARITVALKNRLRHRVYVSVVALTSLWGIEQIFPGGGVSRPLGSREETRFSLRAVLWAGQDHGRERLKFFVTLAPVRFGWLEQPPFEAASSGTPEARSTLRAVRRRRPGAFTPSHPLEHAMRAWSLGVPPEPGAASDPAASSRWGVFDLVFDIRKTTP